MALLSYSASFVEVRRLCVSRAANAKSEIGGPSAETAGRRTVREREMGIESPFRASRSILE
jgi:hypothetical protein